MPELISEIQRRRTFAIISHPDAGKTTLTEKLLLYGGAIHLAGAVKSRKSKKHAVSDWMEIEKQRGISVTSSVLQFEYSGFKVNILDTPGHQDFSEDTYRTLMAADSVVMLIDLARGVEAQTKKLFWVSKRRKLPIFTFVNKLDRYGRTPFEIMDELEKVLSIKTFPITWPIGTDGNYIGMYNRITETVDLFNKGSGLTFVSGNLKDPQIMELIGDYYNTLLEEIELLDMAGDKFDINLVKSGDLTPVFFGSAMTSFGVETFLKNFLELSPSPQPRSIKDGLIKPEDNNFSAFVFKIQANMNPAHRDRIAFLRICSGKFEKESTFFHTQSEKTIRLPQPQQFLAQERVIIEDAYPGDIIGVFDPGIFSIGDTVCSEAQKLEFEDFPVFPPEQFALVQPKDSMKRKQFIKGMTQLAQEGAIQVFKQLDTSSESFIVGVVGSLQLEVLEHRLLNEYGVKLLLSNLPFSLARWTLGDKDAMENIKGLDNGMLVTDIKDRPVVLLNNEWSLNWLIERNTKLTFLIVPTDAKKI